MVMIRVCGLTRIVSQAALLSGSVASSGLLLSVSI